MPRPAFPRVARGPSRSSPSAATAATSSPRTATSTSLLVHDGRPAGIEELAAALWYPLWDAGLQLGHAVRSLDQQLARADEDLDAATALLSARPIAGDDELGGRLVAEGAPAGGATAAGGSTPCARG